MPTQSELEQLFVVRFWADRAAAERPQWRGCVDHIASGERRFFVDLDALAEFIGSCLRGETP